MLSILPELEPPSSAVGTATANATAIAVAHGSDAPLWFPGFWQSVRLLLLFLFGLGAILAMAWVLFVRPAGGGGAELLVRGLPVLAAIWFGRRWSGRSWTAVIPIHRVPFAALLPFVVAMVGLTFTINLPDILLSRVLPSDSSWLERMIRGAGFVHVVLLAPVLEEVLFRGLILGGYRQRYRPTKAIVLCALLFALIHSPWQYPVALIAGAYFSWLVIETGSLVLPVLGHLALNGWAWYQLSHPEMMTSLEVHALALWGPGLLLLAGGSWLVRRACRRDVSVSGMLP